MTERLNRSTEYNGNFSSKCSYVRGWVCGDVSTAMMGMTSKGKLECDDGLHTQKVGKNSLTRPNAKKMECDGREEGVTDLERALAMQH